MLSFCLINQAPVPEDMGNGDQLRFLTFTLDGGEWSASCPGCFALGQSSAEPLWNKQKTLCLCQESNHESRILKP